MWGGYKSPPSYPSVGGRRSQPPAAIPAKRPQQKPLVLLRFHGNPGMRSRAPFGGGDARGRGASATPRDAHPAAGSTDPVRRSRILAGTDPGRADPPGSRSPRRDLPSLHPTAFPHAVGLGLPESLAGARLPPTSARPRLPRQSHRVPEPERNPGRGSGQLRVLPGLGRASEAPKPSARHPGLDFPPPSRTRVWIRGPRCHEIQPRSAAGIAEPGIRVYPIFYPIFYPILRALQSHFEGIFRASSWERHPTPPEELPGSFFG